MANTTDPLDTTIPNQAANKEKAEGSRMDDNTEGAGITNRPIETEEREQQKLPPRGQSKDGAHA